MPSRLTVVYCTQQHCPHILKGFDALNTILYYVCGSCLYLNLLTISSLGDCLDYVQPSKHCLVGTATESYPCMSGFEIGHLPPLRRTIFEDLLHIFQSEKYSRQV